VERTWKPTAAGILDIFTGSLKVISILSLVFLVQGLSEFVELSGADFYGIDITGQLSVALWASAVLVAVFGVLAIVGGIYALRRKKWGWALAGSIAALFPYILFGALAIIFTVLSKEEFE